MAKKYLFLNTITKRKISGSTTDASMFAPMKGKWQNKLQIWQKETGLQTCQKNIFLWV